MDEEPAILEDETVAQTAPADFEDRQAGALFNDIAYSFYVANGVIKAPPAVRAGAWDELAAGRRRLIDRVGLDREYWCAYIPGGVWLSTEPKLYVSLNNNETTRAELVALLDDCGALGVAADELLEGRDRSRLLGSLFEVMTNVLYLAIIGRARQEAKGPSVQPVLQRLIGRVPAAVPRSSSAVQSPGTATSAVLVLRGHGGRGSCPCWRGGRSRLGGALLAADGCARGRHSGRVCHRGCLGGNIQRFVTDDCGSPPAQTRGRKADVVDPGGRTPGCRRRSRRRAVPVH